MMNQHSPHIWLSYVSYPLTTAMYLERALRRICRVTTVGPRLPEELIARWNLSNLRQPIPAHDIDTSMTPDMADILARTAPADHPDLYLWVESVNGHQPSNLEALSCPKIGYLIDTHLNLSHHRELARLFDTVFLVHQQFVDDIRKINPNTHWSPVACDPEIHSARYTHKSFDISFVGSIQSGSRRHQLLSHLNSLFPVHYERCFLKEMAGVFARSKIVFNEAVKDDLNMRVFEVMSTGALLLTDMTANSGQDILFRDGEECAIYRDATIAETVRFYLENDELREQIARRGQHVVHTAHTYAHRVADLLAVVMGEKATTFSAEELRKQSLAGITPLDAGQSPRISASSARRSFLIPVQDMSPTSQYTILRLLDDLKEIEGDVIVVGNGAEATPLIMKHPRITRHAFINQNIGIAQAKNMCLEMTATPIAFIMNADLHIERAAVELLEQALLSLPDAGCVGPQGGYINYALTRNYSYLDKGTFNQPLVVDAVSGFFFAIKTEHFNNKTIRFESAFTSSFFEELDIGLQFKQAGLKNYVVPVTGYDYHCEDSVPEILQHNRLYFLNKWRAIADRLENPVLLTSGFMEYIADQAELLIAEGRFMDADAMIERAATLAPENDRVTSIKRFCSILAEKINPDSALRFL